MYNSDKFDHLIAMAAAKCIEKEAQEFNEIDTLDVEFSASYYRKRAKTIRRCKRLGSRSFSRAFVVKLVAVVAAVAMLIGVAIGCMPELRQAIYNAIVEWYDDYFAVRYESTDGGDRETGFNEETEAENDTEIAAPTYIVSVRKPTNLPEGVREDYVLKNSTKVMIDFYVDEQYLFSFSQFILKPSDKYVDSEEINVSYIRIGENDATIVEYIAQSEICVLWSDKEYAYQIVSDVIGIDELVKYAESIE